MSEAARRELKSWGKGLVCVSRDGPARCELLLRLEGVSPPGRSTTVALWFERQSHWFAENITRAEVAPHEVVMHHSDAQERFAATAARGNSWLRPRAFAG